MPYKDPDVQRKYAREWMRRRRDEWFANKACVDCGSTENLELDHLDPSQKVTHRVWSWTKERREVELAKCVARCEDCHKKRSTSQVVRGERNGRSKFTEAEVVEMRRRNMSGEDCASIAASMGVNRKSVWWAVNSGWKHI